MNEPREIPSALFEDVLRARPFQGRVLKAEVYTLRKSSDPELNAKLKARPESVGDIIVKKNDGSQLHMIAWPADTNQIAFVESLLIDHTYTFPDVLRDWLQRKPTK